MTTADDKTWSLLVDGATNQRGSGLGMVLISPDDDILERAVKCEWRTTNNEAEYEALILGLQSTISMGTSRLRVNSDSQLVVNQVCGHYQTKDAKKVAYLNVVEQLKALLTYFKIKQVPRDYVIRVDLLANLGAMAEFTCDRQIVVTILRQSILHEIDQPQEIFSVQANDWRTPIRLYMQNYELPPDKREARKIKAQSARYTLLGLPGDPDRVLYRRYYDCPLLRCVHVEEVDYILKELHCGSAGGHIGPRSVALAAHRAGYFWPTMRTDARNFVIKCAECQKHANVAHLPAEELHSYTPSWPFARWGMDIVGKLPKTANGKEYILVATD